MSVHNLWEREKTQGVEWNLHYAHSFCLSILEFLDLRMVNEDRECAGWLEVFYNGTWGSVCRSPMEAIQGCVCVGACLYLCGIWTVIRNKPFLKTEVKRSFQLVIRARIQ